LGGPMDDDLNEALRVVYPELKRLARRQLSRYPRRPTLNTTEIVHEAYIRLQRAGSEWGDREHLLAIAARAMRHLLVDLARARRSQKRGGGQAIDEQVDVEQLRVELPDGAVKILDVHAVLNRLAEMDSRLVSVVECRYFAGLTEGETAKALGVSATTVQRDWQRARAWISKKLKP
jgi:RNA polymerase sigma factor (TIGR02999 family)